MLWAYRITTSLVYREEYNHYPSIFIALDCIGYIDGIILCTPAIYDI